MLARRKLGAQGLEVPEVGLGCWGMSNPYGPANETESIATIHRALDLGCSFLDTAQSYGPFTNEDLIGRALVGKRDGVTIATKFGFRFVEGKSAGLDSRPAFIRESVEASLRRLRTDRVDLLYQHRVDPAVPTEAVAGAVADLVRAGKVLYLGLSEAGVRTIKRAHAIHPVSALQSEYSLWERNLEAEVIPLLRSLGIGLVAFSPLGRGFLAGAVKRAEDYPATDWRHDDPRFQGTNFEANMAAAETVLAIAQAHGATAAQVGLAWLLCKGRDIVPIPGTRSRLHLEDNLASTRLRLSSDDLQRLDAALRPEHVAGPRYGVAGMAMIDR